jgi:hypothetical protein
MHFPDHSISSCLNNLAIALDPFDASPSGDGSSPSWVAQTRSSRGTPNRLLPTQRPLKE